MRYTTSTNCEQLRPERRAPRIDGRPLKDEGRGKRGRDLDFHGNVSPLECKRRKAPRAEVLSRRASREHHGDARIECRRHTKPSRFIIVKERARPPQYGLPRTPGRRANRATGPRAPAYARPRVLPMLRPTKYKMRRRNR